jgi:hypothetical protein
MRVGLGGERAVVRLLEQRSGASARNESAVSRYISANTELIAKDSNSHSNC